MVPCSRARCRHCGMNVGIFGLKGFGWSLRQHEASCAAISAPTTVEATTTEPMLAAGLVKAAATWASRVEVAVDVTVLPEKDLVRRLHVRKDELKQLREADVQMASEVMLLGLFTWRPGSSDAGPLCSALGMGPGDDGEILVKARPGRLPRRAPLSGINTEFGSRFQRATTRRAHGYKFHGRFQRGFPRHCASAMHEATAATQGLAPNLMAGQGGG